MPPDMPIMVIMSDITPPIIPLMPPWRIIESCPHGQVIPGVERRRRGQACSNGYAGGQGLQMLVHGQVLSSGFGGSITGIAEPAIGSSGCAD